MNIEGGTELTEAQKATVEDFRGSGALTEVAGIENYSYTARKTFPRETHTGIDSLYAGKRSYLSTAFDKCLI